MLETAANFIRSGRYKKIIIVGADKMSSVVDYTDRSTCPIFGDGAAAFMMEPTAEDFGVMDSVLRTDGKGLPFLHMKAGGSVCPSSYFTVDNHMIADENSNNIISRVTYPTVHLGIKGLSMFNLICIVITAPMKNEISRTIPIELTPNFSISLMNCLKDIRNRSGRPNVRPISMLWVIVR